MISTFIHSRRCSKIAVITAKYPLVQRLFTDRAGHVYRLKKQNTQKPQLLTGVFGVLLMTDVELICEFLIFKFACFFMAIFSSICYNKVCKQYVYKNQIYSEGGLLC